MYSSLSLDLLSDKMAVDAQDVVTKDKKSRKKKKQMTDDLAAAALDLPSGDTKDNLVYGLTKRRFRLDYGAPLTYQIPLFSGKFEKVVDDSDFVPTAKMKRDKIATGRIGGDRGLYDSDELKDGERRTDIELALRSGVMDKADVQKLSSSETFKAERSAAKKREADALEQEKKRAESRQNKLDELLNVNQD